MTATTALNATYELQTNHWVIASYYCCYTGFQYYVDQYGYSTVSAQNFTGQGTVTAPGSLNDASSDSYYIASTYLTQTTDLPTISGVDPNWPADGVLNSSGYTVLYGSNFTPNTQVNISGAGVSMSFTYISAGQVNLYYTISQSASTGAQSLSISNTFGASNAITFTVGDPTPTVSSISPGAWDAGVSTPFTISGSGFGTSPTVSTSDSYASISVTSVSDTYIMATANVNANDPGGAVTVYVTSNGYGNGWQPATPGQSNRGAAQAQVIPAARISLTRQSLTQASATGTPPGGSFFRGATAYANISFAPGVNGQSNPSSAVLTNAGNPSGTGAPSPGALATVSAGYTPSSGAPASATFHVATFGMSCYYTALQTDWGTAPNSCGSTRIYGVVYSGSWANPPGLPAGNYCNAFLAQVSLQGSGVLATGTDVGYVSGGYPPNSTYKVITSISSADGSPVVAGRTVARDRSIIPGTGVHVDINGIGNGLLANDTGGGITGYRLDLYNGAGAAACGSFSNIMAVSGCNPGNASCPSDTAIQ